MRDPAVALLLRLLDESYRKSAWQGPNLKGSLRGVDASQAAWRPAPGRHNVWELVVHAAYWKYAVVRRLTGAKRGRFTLKGSNWFARTGKPTPAQWHEDLALLEASHQAFREVVASLTPGDLRRTAPGAEFDTFGLVSGVAAHDFYHAGQIQLLKRMMRSL